MGGVGGEARMGREGEKKRGEKGRGGGLKVSQSSVVGKAAKAILWRSC